MSVHSSLFLFLLGSGRGCTRMQFETLDSRVAKSFMKIMNSKFKSKVQMAEEMQEEKGLLMLIGRQIAFHDLHFQDQRHTTASLGMNDFF